MLVLVLVLLLLVLVLVLVNLLLLVGDGDPLRRAGLLERTPLSRLVRRGREF